MACFNDWTAVRYGNENVGYTYSQKSCIVIAVRLLGLCISLCLIICGTSDISTYVIFVIKSNATYFKSALFVS